MEHLSKALFAGLIVAVISVNEAIASPSVELRDPAYLDVDKLVSLGWVESAIYSQRPWSREEFARLALEAETYLQSKCASCEHRDEGTKVIESLERKFAPEIRVKKGGIREWIKKPLDRADLWVSEMRAHPRDIPPDNGLGGLSAVLDPMTDYREGLRSTNGFNGLVRTQSWIAYPGVFSAFAEPEFEMRGEAGPTHNEYFDFHKAYGNLTWGTVDLEVGRDSIAWGQGQYGGSLLSVNARPLDMIKLSTPSPVHLPGFLGALGPFRATFFLSDLGMSRESPHASLVGLSLAAHPWPLLELNFEHTYIIGGQLRESSWRNYVAEGVFLRPCGGSCGDSADHRMGGSLRLRVPPLGNAQVYTEFTWEDAGRDSIAADLSYRLATQTGLYLPVAFWDFDSDLRIQYSEASPLLYRHSNFVSGYELDGHVLGLSGGTASKELEIAYGKNWSDQSRLSIRAFGSLFDGNTYSQTSDFTLQTLVSVPREKRARAEVSYRWDFRPDLQVEPAAGYERVWNFDFEQGNSVSNWMVGLHLKYSPVTD